LQEEARRRVGPLDTFEGADDRVRRLAEAVTVEVEAAVTPPDVAAALDRPAGARVAAADDDVAPVVLEDAIVKRRCRALE